MNGVRYVAGIRLLQSPSASPLGIAGTRLPVHGWYVVASGNSSCMIQSDWCLWIPRGRSKANHVRFPNIRSYALRGDYYSRFDTTDARIILALQCPVSNPVIRRFTGHSTPECI